MSSAPTAVLPAPAPPAAPPRPDRVRALVLALAVGVAFADSAIVVLALPELIGEFGASVGGVAWVVTSFNVVVAAVALVLAPRAGREAPGRLVRIGLMVFAVASAGCAVAPALPVLRTARAVQGVGAALLLGGSLPLLGQLLGSRRKAVAVWALAGSTGAALGPAVGGALTEVFDWRAIFVAQLPPAILALLVLPWRRGEAPRAPAAVRWRPGRDTLAADIALGLVSGALVAALFPAVVLLINGWGQSPLGAAAIVSALPLATIVARPWARALPLRVGLAAGVLLLAAGLVALALLPSRSVAIAACALALCGLGLGLTLPALIDAGLGDGPALAERGSWSVGIRHLGLVLGLVALTPLLAHDLGTAAQDITQTGAARLLDAPLTISQKVSLATDLEKRVREASGDPDALWQPFREREKEEPALTPLRRGLQELLGATLTRGFRRGFLLAAGIALLALIPVATLRPRRRT